MFFALPFPVIDPVLIQFGPLAIRWYALAYIGGIVFGWWLGQAIAKHPELFGATKVPAQNDIDDFLIWIVLGIVLGGRLGFVLFYNLPFYASDPLQVLKLWQGGMSFHGGMIGLATATYIFSKRRNIHFLTLMDMVAAVTPIGLFLGRVANFINGELYGRASDMPWAVMFPRGNLIPRHPSQLYEAGLEGILLFAVLMTAIWHFRALQKPGIITGLFLIIYGLSRCVVELFREPDAQLGYLWGGITMGQLLSLPMIAAGIALIVLAAKRKNQNA